MTAQPDTFTCGSCGGTFPKGWSDEEADAEARENFPGLDLADECETAVVCDDCYKMIMAKAEADGIIGPEWRNAGEP